VTLITIDDIFAIEVDGAFVLGTAPLVLGTAPLVLGTAPLDRVHSTGLRYGVAWISRLLKIIGLFCKRAL